ncbi:hypothetical protein F4561_002417 [Lipingzhangella halophila]|uniref:Transposase YdaD n=1 Tax=Lipingzhangella halophila TaxID=1783352 RepID=A0A7W7RGR9_9ACTN|nr:hypothetical protein [Lipingzhangella halophila]MBB4931597.1 hypothetical protein [Lipingzhangella halophila]
MPGFDHELQVQLFQRNPDLAPALLDEVCSFPIPDYARAEIGCADLTNLTPKPYKADDVTVLYAADGKRLLAVITETQQREDQDKPFTWPVYVTTVRERLRCPVRLLVVCPDVKTAVWARMPIEVEAGGATLCPAAIGPNEVPVVNDTAKAMSLPELSVLSAAAHGDDPAVLKAAEAALDVVPERTRLIYNDFIEARLSAAARKLWEDMMATGTYEWQSDFARKYVGQGRAEGRSEGKSEGKAEDIVMILGARGFAVSEAQCERIRSCTDLDQLNTWLTRAVTAETVEELFD